MVLAHAAADTEGDHSTGRIATLELVHHGSHQHCARRAQRVAHRDRTAVDIELLVRDAEIVLIPQHDGRERLVDLDKVDVFDGHADVRQQLVRCGCWSSQHDRGVGTRGCGGDNTGARRQAKLFPHAFAADENQRRSVHDS
jgi:hypothetical protein